MRKSRMHHRSSSMAQVAGTTAGNPHKTRSISIANVATSCQPNMATRRMDAIHELLSSERAYARDLALVCDLHIPLAQGKPVCIPGSSNFSASPRSGTSPALNFSASSASTSSPRSRSPMTNEDVRIVFRNISDIASFSSRFVKRLETAIDRTSNDSGIDEDKVGELFLEMIPDIERLYKTYSATHSAALTHFSWLSSSPALWGYLSDIRSFLPSDIRIPDLPSFLMRPAQRVPEYYRLLGSIIDTTPVSHTDLAAPLAQACVRMGKVARDLNSVRENVPIVPPIKISTTFNGTNASANTEPNELAQLESRLYDYSNFLGRLAEHIKDWEIETRRCVDSLQRWSIAFGAVLGLPPLQSASYPLAYAAFTSLLSSLSGLCTTLEMSLDPFLRKLEAMTEHPKRLLKELHTLESPRTPSHFSRIRRSNTSKNHQRYRSLRSQLSSQLPTLLGKMDRAIGLAVRIVTQGFLKAVREKWTKLFDSLKGEGECYGGAEETLSAWRERWEVAGQILSIWEERFELEEPAVWVNHPSARSDMSLPVRLSVTSAELPPANDVPSVPPGSPPRLRMRFSFPPSSLSYTIRALRSYNPPPHGPYRGHSFFTLVDGDCFEVLEECDHPSIHTDLPRCFVSKRDEDCLLKVRARNRGIGYESGDVGWALARFVSID
ncbi:hypothetical protein HD554DRAFT_1238279 [Boletus coccyginus]|nr:hypothetical protein HD554DRAFT_1238279 [Boletus coccyginus]